MVPTGIPAGILFRNPCFYHLVHAPPPHNRNGAMGPWSHGTIMGLCECGIVGPGITIVPWSPWPHSPNGPIAPWPHGPNGDVGLWGYRIMPLRDQGVLWPHPCRNHFRNPFRNPFGNPFGCPFGNPFRNPKEITKRILKRASKRVS